MDRTRISFALAGFALMLPYMLGSFFPEMFWATNNPGFLPRPYHLVTFLVAGFLIAMPLWYKKALPEFGSELSKRTLNGLLVLVSLAIAWLFWSNPIAQDTYGDAYYIRRSVDLEIPAWDSRLFTDFLKFDWFDSKVGLKTYYRVINFFTWLFGVNGEVVARVLVAVLGGVYAFVWLKLIIRLFTSNAWRFMFGVTGLAMPLTAVFMGHYEVYAFTYLGILVWMAALMAFF